MLAVDGYNLEHIEKALNFKKFPSLQQSISSTLLGDQKYSPSGAGGSVWGTVRGLFSVSNVRSRYDTAIPVRMTVRQKQPAPVFGFYCTSGDDSAVSESMGNEERRRKLVMPVVPVPVGKHSDKPNSLRYICADPRGRGIGSNAASAAPTKIVKLKPDFTYLDGKERVLHTRLIKNSGCLHFSKTENIYIHH